MVTILLGFALMAFVMTAMAIGVIMGRKPITGSCGGVGAALGEKDYECDLCGGDPKKCEENSTKDAMKTDLAVDVSQKTND